MARSRRTQAMLVGRCSSELPGHRLQGNLKSHSLRAQPTCLRQVEREMTPAIVMDARPGGPTAKRQPSPEGLGNQIRRGSERRRCGTVSLGVCDLFSGCQFFLGTRIRYPNMNCHPDRSVAKWRDLRFSIPATNPDGTTTLPFVIPSEAESLP